MFHPGGAGYFVPASVPQPGPRGYLPPVAGGAMSPAGTMRTTVPRWNSMGAAQSAMPRVQSSYTNGTVSGYPQQMYAQTVPTMNPRNRVATGQGQIAGVRQQTTSGSSSTQSARPITGQIMQTRLNGKWF